MKKVVKYVLKTNIKTIIADINEYNDMKSALKNLAGCKKSLEASITQTSVAGEQAPSYRCVNKVFRTASDAACADVVRPEWTENCMHFTDLAPCRMSTCRCNNINNNYVEIAQKHLILKCKVDGFWANKFANVR